MLKNRSDYLRVRSGVRANGRGFFVQGVLQKGPAVEGSAPSSPFLDQPCRFGITVTNKTVRQLLQGPLKAGEDRRPLKAKPKGSEGLGQKRGPVSVKRNLLRRRLKEALRQIAPKLEIRGVDFVIVGRPELHSIKFDRLMKDLEKSFHSISRKLISTGSQKKSGPRC